MIHRVKHSKLQRGALHTPTDTLPVLMHWILHAVFFIFYFYWSSSSSKHRQFFFWHQVWGKADSFNWRDKLHIHTFLPQLARQKQSWPVKPYIKKWTKYKILHPQPEVPRQQSDFSAIPNAGKGSCVLSSKMNTRHQKWIPKMQPASYDVCT